MPLMKLLAKILAGGFFGGIALAFLMELFLDQSIKRPIEVETKLRLPLFLSIPDTAWKGLWRFPRFSPNAHTRASGRSRGIHVPNTHSPPRKSHSPTPSVRSNPPP